MPWHSTVWHGAACVSYISNRNIVIWSLRALTFKTIYDTFALCKKTTKSESIIHSRCGTRTETTWKLEKESVFFFVARSKYIRIDISIFSQYRLNILTWFIRFQIACVTYWKVCWWWSHILYTIEFWKGGTRTTKKRRSRRKKVTGIDGV